MITFKEPQIYRAELPFTLERLDNETQLALVRRVKHQELLTLFEKILEEVPDFDGFSVDCKISMEIHNFYSVYNKICDLREKGDYHDRTEIERLEVILNKLGTGDRHYGDTHLLQLTVTTK